MYNEVARLTIEQHSSIKLNPNALRRQADFLAWKLQSPRRGNRLRIQNTWNLHSGLLLYGRHWRFHPVKINTLYLVWYRVFYLSRIEIVIRSFSNRGGTLLWMKFIFVRSRHKAGVFFVHLLNFLYIHLIKDEYPMLISLA